MVEKYKELLEKCIEISEHVGKIDYPNIRVVRLDELEDILLELEEEENKIN